MDGGLTTHLAARKEAMEELKRKLEEEEEEYGIVKRIQSEEVRRKEEECNKGMEMIESIQAGE